MKKLFIILILISSSYVLGYTGSSYQYGYSAKSFALSDSLVADNYQTFQVEEIFMLLYLPGFDLFRLFLDRLLFDLF